MAPTNQGLSQCIIREKYFGHLNVPQQHHTDLCFSSTSQLWICVRRWTTAVNISVSAPTIPTSADVLKDLRWLKTERAAKVRSLWYRPSPFRISITIHKARVWCFWQRQSAATESWIWFSWSTALRVWALPTLSGSSGLWTALWTRWTFPGQAHTSACFSSPRRCGQSSPWASTPQHRPSNRLYPGCSIWGEAPWPALPYATCLSPAFQLKKEPGLTSLASASCLLMADPRMMCLNGLLKQRTLVLFLPVRCWQQFLIKVFSNKSFLSLSCVLLFPGVTIYALGIGKAIEQELREIASEPDETHLYYAEDFEQMGEITKKLKSRICKGTKSLKYGWTHRKGCPEVC